MDGVDFGEYRPRAGSVADFPNLLGVCGAFHGDLLEHGDFVDAHSDLGRVGSSNVHSPALSHASGHTRLHYVVHASGSDSAQRDRFRQWKTGFEIVGSHYLK